MIRHADVPDDVARLCELELLLFPGNSLSVLQMERELGRSACLVIGRPVKAYALIGWDGELLDLLRLGVHPDHQGRGLGKRLLRAVLAVKRPMVLTVKKDNHRALRLYEEYGFEVVGHFSEARAWVLFRPVAGTSCPSR